MMEESGRCVHKRTIRCTKHNLPIILYTISDNKFSAYYFDRFNFEKIKYNCGDYHSYIKGELNQNFVGGC